jgi:cell division protein FtsL
MSNAEIPVKRDGWDRLPAWLRPRDVELGGTGRRRLVEVTLLLLAGLLLAIATANDVVKQTHVNHRLIADLRTWRSYTGHDYRNLSTEQDLYGHTTRDVVCGNTTPGAPKERVQLCLRMTGAVIRGQRTAGGGWYLPPKVEDVPASRYGCFGTAKSAQLCGPAARGSESPEGTSQETGQ